MDEECFTLSSAELADSFLSTGRFPAQAEFFASLPTGEKANSSMHPVLRDMITVIANPGLTLRLADFRESPSSVSDICIFQGGQGVAAAVTRLPDQRWELLHLADHAALLALVGRLTGSLKEAQETAFSFQPEKLDRVAHDHVICSECGTLFDDPPAFCRQCGASLAALES